MKTFIHDGIYVYGDMLPGDIEVYERPSVNHTWKDGAWTLDSKKRLKEATASYNEDTIALQEQYVSALFSDNTDAANDVKAEAATRKTDYLAELTKIRSGAL